MRSTHYKLKSREIPDDGFIGLDLLDVRKLFNDIKTSKSLVIPDLNRRIIVGTRNGSHWSTIMTSDIERKHVLWKWKVIKWQYDRQSESTSNI